MCAEGDGWKLSLPCTRTEAELLTGDVPALAAFDSQPVLMTSEANEAAPDAWRLDAYFDAEPDAGMVALIVDLVPSAAGRQPTVERLASEDWVAMSQVGLEPIRAGRFFVHTPIHAGAVPAGMTAFEIDAGRAFGTGHHETTTGCLLMIDRLKRSGYRFGDVADIGTGTGLLAFAARSAWRGARVIASDIDPVSIAVAAQNAAVNRVPIGRLPGRVELATAPGLAHPRLAARAPYDLLIANILAEPLIELAEHFAEALLPGGSLILAGLLDSHSKRVARAYRRHGLRLADTIECGDWPTLRMVKRAGWKKANATRYK